MILQYMVASAVNRCKILANPASTDSIPTSRGQEDYVSMGTNAGWKLREQLSHVQAVLAAEVIASCQAIDLGNDELPEQFQELGAGTQVVYDLVRKKIDRMKGDRWLHPDLAEIIELVAGRDIRHELKRVV